MIRGISKSKDNAVLKKRKEKDNKFLIEKLIYSVEEENQITTKEKQKLCLSWKETIEYVGVSTSL